MYRLAVERKNLLQIIEKLKTKKKYIWNCVEESLT